MALVVDGFKVLRKLSKQPELFAAVSLDATKAAQSLVEKQLKAKSTDSKALAKIYSALGSENFGLVIEGMKDSAVKSLVARLDKHNPQIKAADANWRRRHAIALASGSTEPLPKPERVKKEKKATTARKSPTKPADPPRLSHEVFDALKRRG
jgi:hypothetical protein